MNGQGRSALEGEQDLLPRRACVKRGPNVVARSRRIEICAGGIQADTDQLDKLERQNGMGPGIGAHPEAEFGPLWIPLAHRVQSRIPRTRNCTGHLICFCFGFLRFDTHDFSFSKLRS
jgi:hypothetical protein